MALVRVIGRSPWLAVWRSEPDAARGLAEPAPDQDNAIRFDAEACEGSSRLLFPLDALLRDAAQAIAGEATLELTLSAARVAERRPVEWVALLHGATARSLTFLKRLESLPVFGTRPRQRSWVVPLAELGAYQGRLFFALQFLPQAPPCTVALRLSCDGAGAAPAPAAPPPEPPTASPAPPPEAPPASAGRADRLRALPDGALLLFKTAADAKACHWAEEAAQDDAPYRIAIDLRGCKGEVRLLRPLPDLAPRLHSLPEGLALPLRLSLDIPAESRPGLLWAALTQGTSPFDVALHSWIAKRLAATAGAARWDAAVMPPMAEDAVAYLTLQFAPGAGLVRLGRSEVSLGAHLGAFEACDSLAGILARLAPGTRGATLALRRGDRHFTVPAFQETLPGGETRLGLEPMRLGRFLAEAGLADGAPFDVLLLAGSLLVERRSLAWVVPDVAGALEEASPARIRGWVAPPVAVEVLVNGLPLLTLPAGLPRLHPQGAGGFEMQLLVGSGAEAEVVALRDAATGSAIGEPRRLAGLPARRQDRHRARLARSRLRQAPAVSLVLPLRDETATAAAACLAALTRHTRMPARLILLDQGCTSPAAEALLAQALARPGTQLLAGADLNAAIAAAGADDVVLLDPASLPGPRWLERLRFAALAEDRVGSVSALPATALPPLPQDWPAEAVARFVAQAAPGLLADTPLMGAGCVYLRREALTAVGPFDLEGLPGSAAWRADWSLRGLYLGFRHLVEEGCLVDRAPPAADAAPADLLGHRYPELPRLLAAQAADPAPATIAHRLAMRAAGAPAPRPRALFVISSRTGGMPQTNADLMRALGTTHETLLLHSDSRLLTLARVEAGVETVLETHELAEPVNILHHRSPAYDAVVGEWLSAHAIELVHLRHLARHGLGVAEAARALGIPVLLSFHDFYTLCPTVKLLDAEGTPCGGVCTQGPGECRAELWPREGVPPLRNRWVANWRALMQPALDACDGFVTTSTGAKALLQRGFPGLASRPFPVIPHGRDLPELAAPLVATPTPGEKLRLLVLGNIGPAKGAELLARVLELDTEGRIELHVAGEIGAELRAARAFLHGPYAREDFVQVVAQVRPHLGAVLSLWPETYSHTLTELWACGIPVLGFERGAVGERLRETGGGWLLDDPSPPAVLAALLAIGANPQDHAARVAAVEAWRLGEGRRWDVAAMAEAYRALYAAIGA